MSSNLFYIQYRCDEKVRGVVQPQPYQHVIVIPYHPQDNQIKVNLASQQRRSVRVHSYAYPQHMNVLKHFLYIQYGCGEKVRGVIQPQPCHHVIIIPHHLQIAHIWVNMLASSVTVKWLIHMPI